jgi:hypothetical protein
MTMVSDSALIKLKSVGENQLKCSLCKYIVEIFNVVNLLHLGFAIWKKEDTHNTQRIAYFEQEVVL